MESHQLAPFGGVARTSEHRSDEILMCAARSDQPYEGLLFRPSVLVGLRMLNNSVNHLLNDGMAHLMLYLSETFTLTHWCARTNLSV